MSRPVGLAATKLVDSAARTRDVVFILMSPFDDGYDDLYNNDCARNAA